jgi:hypothetical protein
MYYSSFIFQQGLQEQQMMMRMGKSTAWALIAAATIIVAQPAFANNKDRNKRIETGAEVSESCKAAIRSMSESTPQRKSDCPKTRRILM